MCKLPRRTYVVAAFAVALASISIESFAQTAPTPGSAPKPGSAPTPGSAPVTIVNPLPLPITGSTSVSGTVSIEGTVPVTVTNVLSDGMPYSHSQNATCPIGSFCNVLFQEVPAGKLLVVKQVSMRVTDADGTAPFKIATFVGSSTGSGEVGVDFVMQRVGALFVGSPPIVAFVQGGEAPRMIAPTGTATNVAGSVIGYLIDAPE